MTDPTHPPPPRLVTDRALPPYAYIPGRHPHPTREPGGHSYAVEPVTPPAPDPGDWRASPDYLYGIDLFNHRFYWEAHEAWEGLWVACGREGLSATFLQGLINLAAVGFKARWGSARGMKANGGTALRLFEAVQAELGHGTPRYMGLEVAALADFTRAIVRGRGPATARRDGELPFDLYLRPE